MSRWGQLQGDPQVEADKDRVGEGGDQVQDRDASEQVQGGDHQVEAVQHTEDKAQVGKVGDQVNMGDDSGNKVGADGRVQVGDDDHVQDDKVQIVEVGG